MRLGNSAPIIMVLAGCRLNDIGGFLERQDEGNLALAVFAVRMPAKQNGAEDRRCALLTPISCSWAMRPINWPPRRPRGSPIGVRNGASDNCGFPAAKPISNCRR